MPSIPLASVVMIVAVSIGAGFGSGLLIGHGAVGSPSADPYKYCFHLNLTSNTSFIPATMRPFVVPGIYAICKVG